jgi:hypothetical protein
MASLEDLQPNRLSGAFFPTARSRSPACSGSDPTRSRSASRTPKGRWPVSFSSGTGNLPSRPFRPDDRGMPAYTVPYSFRMVKRGSTGRSPTTCGSSRTEPSRSITPAAQAPWVVPWPSCSAAWSSPRRPSACPCAEGASASKWDPAKAHVLLGSVALKRHQVECGRGGATAAQARHGPPAWEALC